MGGHIVRSFEEAPIHYLMGLWGSAFSILINRVMNKTNATEDQQDVSDHDIRQELSAELAQDISTSSFVSATSVDQHSPPHNVTEEDGIDDYHEVFADENATEQQNGTDGNYVKKFAKYVLGKDIVE